MTRFSRILATSVFLTAWPAFAHAQILYSENFDVDNTANWTTNSSAAGQSANYFFDYSTVGIPSAPGSGGSTRGLMMEANVPGTGVFSGVSASPNGQSFSGDYRVRFNAWQNFNGTFPAGGNGSTQMTGGGIGTDGVTAQFPGTSIQGLYFSASGDGGTASDYRAYNATGAPISPVTVPGTYAAGNVAASQNNSDPYYAGFGNQPAPAAQLALFPQQTGNTAVGTQGMAWHQWDILKLGDVVTWSIDGTLIATVNTSTQVFGGSNIFFGQFDINATSSTDPNARSLLFGLIDNVSVERIPEPGSLLLAGLAVPALWRIRRKPNARV